MTAPVWIVASAASAPRWATAFGTLGLDALPLPWSRIEDAVPVADLAARLARRDFDQVLLTSPNAPRVLPAGGGSGLPAACVGEATADAAREAGFEVVHVGSGTGAELAREIVTRSEARRLLFLCGRDVRREGLGVLEAAGFQVTSLVVYEAAALADFPARVAAAPDPSGVAVGSPRAAEALARALQESGRETLRSRPAFAMGVPTAERLDHLGFSTVHAPAVPGAEGLASLAREVLRDGASP